MEQEHGQAYRQGRIHELDRQDDLPLYKLWLENFFGESIMLHQQNLLGDVLRNRPVIVKYQSAVNYVVEACIVVLFLLGILAGRKSKFLMAHPDILPDGCCPPYRFGLRHQRRYIS